MYNMHKVILFDVFLSLNHLQKNVLGLKKISSDFLPMVYDTFSKIPETR